MPLVDHGPIPCPECSSLSAHLAWCSRSAPAPLRRATPPEVVSGAPRTQVLRETQEPTIDVAPERTCACGARLRPGHELCTRCRTRRDYGDA